MVWVNRENTMPIRMPTVALLIAILVPAAALPEKPPPAGKNVPLDLVMLSDAQSKSKGAVCKRCSTSHRAAPRMAPRPLIRG